MLQTFALLNNLVARQAYKGISSWNEYFKTYNKVISLQLASCFLLFLQCNATIADVTGQEKCAEIWNCFQLCCNAVVLRWFHFRRQIFLFFIHVVLILQFRLTIQTRTPSAPYAQMLTGQFDFISFIISWMGRILTSCIRYQAGLLSSFSPPEFNCHHILCDRPVTLYREQLGERAAVTKSATGN